MPGVNVGIASARLRVERALRPSFEKRAAAATLFGGRLVSQLFIEV
jgi:hypothetical protein